MLYLADGSPQHIYLDMKKYFVIGLINLSYSKPTTSSFTIVFVSFNEGLYVWCPSGKISLQINNFSLQGHSRLYFLFLEFLSSQPKVTGITGITEIERNSCSFDSNYPQKGM